MLCSNNSADSSMPDAGAIAGIAVDKEAGFVPLVAAGDCTLVSAWVMEDEDGLVSQSTASPTCCGRIAWQYH